MVEVINNFGVSILSFVVDIFGRLGSATLSQQAFL